MALPTQLNPTEQDALVKQIGLALLRAAPARWTSIVVEYRALGRYLEAGGRVTLGDGTDEDIKVSPDIAMLFGRLRAGMYREGRGTWFNARYQLDQPSAYNLEYDRDEPRWTSPPPLPAYADDLRTFPRDEANVPEWVVRRMAELKPPFRVARIFDAPGPGGRPSVNRPPVNDADDLLHYLDSAPLALPVRGMDTDHLDDEGRQAVPVAFHTDGTWIWPAAVNYYLRAHGVPPEPDLVEHIRRAGFELPEIAELTCQNAAVFLSRGRAPRPNRPGPGEPAGPGLGSAGPAGPGASGLGGPGAVGYAIPRFDAADQAPPGPFGPPHADAASTDSPDFAGAPGPMRPGTDFTSAPTHPESTSPDFGAAPGPVHSGPADSGFAGAPGSVHSSPASSGFGEAPASIRSDSADSGFAGAPGSAHSGPASSGFGEAPGSVHSGPAGSGFGDVPGPMYSGSGGSGFAGAPGSVHSEGIAPSPGFGDAPGSGRPESALSGSEFGDAPHSRSGAGAPESVHSESESGEAAAYAPDDDIEGGPDHGNNGSGRPFDDGGAGIPDSSTPRPRADDTGARSSGGQSSRVSSSPKLPDPRSAQPKVGAAMTGSGRPMESLTESDQDQQSPWIPEEPTDRPAVDIANAFTATGDRETAEAGQAAIYGTPFDAFTPSGTEQAPPPWSRTPERSWAFDGTAEQEEAQPWAPAEVGLPEPETPAAQDQPPWGPVDSAVDEPPTTGWTPKPVDQDSPWAPTAEDDEHTDPTDPTDLGVISHMPLLWDPKSAESTPPVERNGHAHAEPRPRPDLDDDDLADPRPLTPRFEDRPTTEPLDTGWHPDAPTSLPTDSDLDPHPTPDWQPDPTASDSGSRSSDPTSAAHVIEDAGSGRQPNGIAGDPGRRSSGPETADASSDWQPGGVAGDPGRRSPGSESVASSAEAAEAGHQSSGPGHEAIGAGWRPDADASATEPGGSAWQPGDVPDSGRRTAEPRFEDGPTPVGAARFGGSEPGDALREAPSAGQTADSRTDWQLGAAEPGQQSTPVESRPEWQPMAESGEPADPTLWRSAPPGMDEPVFTVPTDQVPSVTATPAPWERAIPEPANDWFTTEPTGWTPATSSPEATGRRALADPTADSLTQPPADPSPDWTDAPSTGRRALADSTQSPSAEPTSSRSTAEPTTSAWSDSQPAETTPDWSTPTSHHTPEPDDPATHPEPSHAWSTAQPTESASGRRALAETDTQATDTASTWPGPAESRPANTDAGREPTDFPTHQADAASAWSGPAEPRPINADPGHSLPESTDIPARQSWSDPAESRSANADTGHALPEPSDIPAHQASDAAFAWSGSAESRPADSDAGTVLSESADIPAHQATDAASTWSGSAESQDTGRVLPESTDVSAHQTDAAFGWSGQAESQSANADACGFLAESAGIPAHQTDAASTWSGPAESRPANTDTGREPTDIPAHQADDASTWSGPAESQPANSGTFSEPSDTPAHQASDAASTWSGSAELQHVNADPEPAGIPVHQASDAASGWSGPADVNAGPESTDVPAHQAMDAEYQPTEAASGRRALAETQDAAPTWSGSNAEPAGRRAAESPDIRAHQMTDAWSGQATGGRRAAAEQADSPAHQTMEAGPTAQPAASTGRRAMPESVDIPAQQMADGWMSRPGEADAGGRASGESVEAGQMTGAAPGSAESQPTNTNAGSTFTESADAASDWSDPAGSQPTEAVSGRRALTDFPAEAATGRRALASDIPGQTTDAPAGWSNQHDDAGPGRRAIQADAASTAPQPGMADTGRRAATESGDVHQVRSAQSQFDTAGTGNRASAEEPDISARQAPDVWSASAESNPQHAESGDPARQTPGVTPAESRTGETEAPGWSDSLPGRANADIPAVTRLPERAVAESASIPATAQQPVDIRQVANADWSGPQPAPGALANQQATGWSAEGPTAPARREGIQHTDTGHRAEHAPQSRHWTPTAETKRPPAAALPSQESPAAAVERLRARLGALGVPESRYRIGSPAGSAWTMEQTGEGWRVGWFDGQFVAPAVFEDVADAAAFLIGKLVLDVARPEPAATVPAPVPLFDDDEEDVTPRRAQPRPVARKTEPVRPPTRTEPTSRRPQDWPIQPRPGEPPLTLFRGKQLLELAPGTEIDRYGETAGNLTYAAGTPFERRSLVPDWVNRPYRAYRVVKPTEALTGVAIPWFEQPGGGVAYLLARSVAELLDKGYLIEVDDRSAPNR